MSIFFKKNKQSRVRMLFVCMLVFSFALARGAAHFAHAQITSQVGTEGTKEICDNDVDDDTDNLIDGADPDCYTLLAPLPGLTSVNTSNGLSSYFNIIFRLAIGIAGVIAVVKIVIYGIQYMTSESITGKGASRAELWSIIGGLLLLIGSVVILNTINPNLTNVGLNLQPVSHTLELEHSEADPLVTPHNTSGPCPYRMTTSHTHEGNANYTSTDPNVQKNLTALSAAVSALDAKVKAAGGTMSVGSAHRSLAYQVHFFDIKMRNFELKADNNRECDDLREQIKKEIGPGPYGHSLSGCNTVKGCIVNPPYTPESCNGNTDQSAAPHVRGTGVDLSFTGITREEADEIAATNNIGIRAQANLSVTDPAHWNLTNPPYTGCASS